MEGTAGNWNTLFIFLKILIFNRFILERDKRERKNTSVGEGTEGRDRVGI